MRGAWLVVVVGAATQARADEAPPSPAHELAATHTRIAVDAARAGHCDVVAELAAKIAALDADYHRDRFATEPAIAACANGTAPRPGEARVASAAQLAAAAAPRRAGTPPLTAGRVFGEAALGVLGGAGGLIAGAIFGANALSCPRTDEGPCDGASYGMVGGLAIGATVGVYLAGTAGDHTGSFAATAVGAAAGTVFGVGIVMSQDELTPLPAIMPLVGAIVGFNLTRRYDDEAPTVGALLRVDGDGLALGIPVVTTAERDGDRRTQLTIIGGAF